MFFLLKSIILFHLSVLVTSTNYCKVQEKFCGPEKHVGCTSNTFEDLDFEDFQMIQITDEFKSIILDEYNTARNRTAFAEVRSTFEIKNMRYLVGNLLKLCIYCLSLILLLFRIGMTNLNI